jgi:aerobic carbon-monoxide dehydrogenase small subunit
VSRAAYTLRVNGTEHAVEGAWEGESLLYVLRERLNHPGAKAGCEEGECGSCSVLLDGVVVCSCLVMAASAAGADVVTVEGLQPAERTALSAIQDALVTEGGVQCGFCTPGIVVAVHALLAGRTAPPSPLEVREALAGNLCRCTGYGRILAAVSDVVAAAAAAGGHTAAGPAGGHTAAGPAGGHTAAGPAGGVGP